MKKILLVLSFFFILGLSCNTTPRMKLFRHFVSRVVPKGKIALSASTGLLSFGFGFVHGRAYWGEFKKECDEIVKLDETVKKFKRIFGQ